MVVPNPKQGEALRRLGMLRPDEIPMLAAHWLADFDSPTLRLLAGLSGSEGWQIDQLWPQVLDDLEVHEVSSEEAWDLATSFQLASWRAGERGATDVMSHVVRAYIENDYPDYAPEAGQLYGLDDELTCSWGRTREEVLAEVERTLTNWAERQDISPP